MQFGEKEYEAVLQTDKRDDRIDVVSAERLYVLWAYSKAEEEGKIRGGGATTRRPRTSLQIITIRVLLEPSSDYLVRIVVIVLSQQWLLERLGLGRC